MLDHLMSQKNEYTPEMIRKELKENAVFSEVEKLQDEKQKKAELDKQRKNYIKDALGENLEKNTNLIEKMNEQEVLKEEKGKRKSITKSSKKGIRVPAKKGSSFKQKLPKVKNGRKFWQVWKTDENDQVKELQKAYKSADLCTLREQKALQKYLDDGGYKEFDLEKTEDDKKSAGFVQRVDEILKFKVTVNMFTEEYLSENIVKLYDYVKKVEDLKGFRYSNKDLFTSLPYDKRLQISERFENSEEMGQLIKKHMNLHGLMIVNDQLKYRQEFGSKDERRQDNLKIKSEYLQMRDNFLEQLEYGQVITQAEALTKLAVNGGGNGFSSESILGPIDEYIASKPKIYKAYGGEIKSAYGEIQKVLSVRDGAIEEMRAILPVYYNTSGDKKEEIKRNIKVLVDRCRVTVTHVENYRNAIRYIAGDRKDIPQGLLSFLKEQKKDDIVDLIDFKSMGDCLEETIGINKRIEEGIISDEQRLLKNQDLKFIYDDLVSEEAMLRQADLEKEESLRDKTKNNSAQKSTGSKKKSKKQIMEEEAERNRKNEIKYRFQKKVFKTRKENPEFGTDAMIHGSANYEKAVERQARIDIEIVETEQEIENNKARNAISTMSEDKFCSMADEYHRLHQPIKNVRKRKEDAEKHQTEMEAASKEYGKQNKFKEVTYNDTIAKMIYDPIQKGEDIKWDWFYKALKLVPEKDTKPEAVKDIIDKGIMPVLNRIFALDEDSIDKLTMPVDNNITKQEIWDNYSLLKVGADGETLKLLIDKYKIDVTKEQQAKIRALRKVAPIMVKRYDMMLSKDRSATEVLFNQKGIANKFNDLLENVVDVDLKKRDESHDIVDWKEKYNKLGMRGNKGYAKALAEDMRNTQKAIDVWSETSGSFKEKYAEEYKKNVDPEVYRKEKEERELQKLQQKQEQEKKEQEEEEKEKIKQEEKGQESGGPDGEDKGPDDEGRDKEEQEKENQEKQKEKQIDKQEEKQIDKQEEKQIDKQEEKQIEKPEEKQIDKQEEKQIEKPEEKKIEKQIEKPKEKQEDKKAEKNEKIIIAADSPEVLKLREEEKKEYMIRDYPEKLYLGYVAKLREKGFEVPADMIKATEIRSKNTVVKYWYETNKNGEQILHGNYFWKDDVDPLFKEAYDWLIGYYRARDKGASKTGPLRKQEMPNYSIKLKGLNEWFEKQDLGSNNCWCCTGTAMYNQFMGKKILDQHDMRGFVPEYKDEKTVTDAGLLPAEYNRHRKMTEKYAGPEATGVGNIFEVGDFFIQKNKDLMLNRMLFTTPALEQGEKTKEQIEQDDILYHNQQVAFLKQVNEVLKTGNAVGLLTTWGEYGHYITIVGIEGQMLNVLDSGQGVPMERKFSVKELLPRKLKGGTTEMTFMTKIKKKDELLSEFSNLIYDEKTGYDVHEVQAESAINVAQTKGICVSKYPKEMEDGMEGISHSVYFSRQAR